MVFFFFNLVNTLATNRIFPYFKHDYCRNKTLTNNNNVFYLYAHTCFQKCGRTNDVEFLYNTKEQTIVLEVFN